LHAITASMNLGRPISLYRF